MGNSPSTRNRSEYPPPRLLNGPPSGPYTSFPPYSSPSPYDSEYSGAMVGRRLDHPRRYSNALRYRHSLPPAFNNQLPQSGSTTLSLHPESARSSGEQQQTIKIRNDVNIQKSTIRLHKDEENPGFYLLSFSFDADSAGSFSIFFFAKEGAACSIMPLNEKIFKPVRMPFEKGSGQKFRQPPGTGVYLDAFDLADLEKEGPDEICPLVIRAQTSAKEPNLESHDSADEAIGGRLPKGVNSQITHAVIEKKDNGDCRVRVLKQILWVDGVRYELQEIYGMENPASEYDENEFGKDCVICMSEPRDTAVMPCRHMCMCNGCASVLKSQMNQCPICRQPVETFLNIKV